MNEKKFSKREAFRFAWEKYKANFIFLILLITIWIGGILICDAIFKTLFFSTKAIFYLKNRSSINEVFPFYRLFSFIAWGWAVIAAPGAYKTILKIVDGEPTDLSELTSDHKTIISFVIGSIIVWQICNLGVGLIGFLLIINVVSGPINKHFDLLSFNGTPAMIGFILAYTFAAFFIAKLLLFPFFILEKGKGPIDSLLQSWKATWNSFFDLFLMTCGVIFGFTYGPNLIKSALSLIFPLHSRYLAEPVIILTYILIFTAIPLLLLIQAYVYRKLTIEKQILPINIQATSSSSDS